MPIRPLVLSLISAAAVLGGASMGGFQVVKKIPISGDGKFDYLCADAGNRRLYVSHGTTVEVVYMDSDTVAGRIEDLKGVHGIAVAPDLGRGFISNGLLSTVTIFDLRTLKHLAEVPAGEGPDGMVYDNATHRVFAFNHKGDTLTVFEGASGKVSASLELGGSPEFPVADGQGTVWVNLEDKSILLRIDSRTLQIKNRWPVAPCAEPASMAMDVGNRRLFIGCGNKVMAVADADSGKILATIPIGEHVDATAFDEERKLIFNANRSTMTVVHQDSADKYSLVETVETLPMANTLAVDEKTHKVYLSTAEFTVPAAIGEKSAPKPVIVPGTFVVLMMSN